MAQFTPTMPAPGDEATELRTFLIADVRGYTRFTQEYGDKAAARLTNAFATISKRVVEVHDGRVIEVRGDEVLAVFGSARAALRGAVELQSALAEQTSLDPSLPLTAGIGLDAGEAVAVEGGFRGSALNLAARLCSLAGPGEVLCSGSVSHLARRIEGIRFIERGLAQLRGFAEPVAVVRVARDDTPGENMAASSPTDTDTSFTANPIPIGGFLGALPEGILVARDREFAHVMTLVDSVSGGRGRTALFAGEPGVGKTRLAQEVTRTVRNRGFFVAPGTCYEPDRSVPYFPFLEALSTLYRSIPAEVREEALAQWPEILRLSPTATFEAQSNHGHDDQIRLFWAITGFLQRVSEAGPVAILIDDLHWADGSSLELFEHIARHTRVNRVLLLGTYRDVEVGRQHPLEPTLLSLSRQRLADRISLKRLDESGTLELVRATIGSDELPPELGQIVHSRTDGNAFFVEEVVRSLVDRGDAYRENGHWQLRTIEESEVPESVRSVIGQRLNQFSEITQDVLREASVLGLTFRFTDLQAVAGRSEADVESSISEAKAGGIIRETGIEEYAFNHALTQQALYDELSLRRKRRMHLAISDALEQLPGEERERRAAELAWHSLQGDDAERALRYSLIAGDHAARVFAHREAEKYFGTAAELALELHDTPRRAESLEKLGAALFTAGLYDDAARALDEATSLYARLGQTEDESRSAARLAWAFFETGTPDDGIARLEPLLQSRAGGQPTAGLAALHIGISNLYFLSGRFREQLAAIERGLALAWVVGDDRLRAQAEMRKGMAYMALGEYDAAIEAMEASIPTAQAVDDVDALYRSYLNMRSLYKLRSNSPKAALYDQKLMEIEQRVGNPVHAASRIASQGADAYFRGDWAEARAALNQAQGIVSKMPQSRIHQATRFGLAQLTFCEGDFESGRKQLEGMAREGREAGNIEVIEGTHFWLAWAAIREGRPAEALEQLHPVIEHRQQEGTRLAQWLAFDALARSEMGDYEQALALADQALDECRSADLQPNTVMVLLVAGKVHTNSGQYGAARALLTESINMAQSGPFAYAEGLAWLELGTTDVLDGSPSVAREEFEKALAVFKRLGAKFDVAVAERKLAGLGEPVLVG